MSAWVKLIFTIADVDYPMNPVDLVIPIDTDAGGVCVGSMFYQRQNPDIPAHCI